MTYTCESAIRRADQVLYEFICDKTTLDGGIVFWSDEFPDSADHNSFREVLIESACQCTAIWDQVEQHFGDMNRTCGSWVPCADQSLDVLDPFFAERDWSRIAYAALQIEEWPQIHPADGVRVLPARAMRQAFRDLHAGDVEGDLAEARLDYPQFDVFVATVDGQPAGRGGLMQAGEVACVRDVYVAPQFRRGGVGRTLLAELLEMARRLMMRIVCCKVPAQSTSALAFLDSLQFKKQAELVEYFRSAPALEA